MTDQRHAHQGLPEFHLHGPDNDLSRQGVLRKVRITTFIVLALMGLGLGKTMFSRASNAEVLAARAVENTKLHVLVTKPTSTLSNASARLALPGTLLGINEAQIYARVNGYVQKWFKDIGDPVKKGDTLAILDIPEINKQVEEATAKNCAPRMLFLNKSSMKKPGSSNKQRRYSSGFATSKALAPSLRLLTAPSHDVMSIWAI
jgi:biotin carboxyl carrier protein